MTLHEVSQFYVLGEDPFHRTFVGAWLRANGVADRRFVVVEPPAGKSGGYTFVLDRCKIEVQAARLRNRSKAKTRVIVVIDADHNSVQERLAEVKSAAGTTDEDIASGLVCVLVPKRHIETWVHALGPTDPRVDEKADYKEKKSEEVKTAARRLARLPSAPTEPPSLVHGYSELQRLKDS